MIEAFSNLLAVRANMYSQKLVTSLQYKKGYSVFSNVWNVLDTSMNIINLLSF